MVRTVPFRLSLAFVAVSSFAGARALAQDGDATERAREHFARGQTAYGQGDLELAIREWNAAYELDARPRIQYNLSQAYERLGRLTEALTALEHYIESADPQDMHQADARARRGAIRERLDQTGIRVVGGPEGASIVVDEDEWGRTPRPDPIRVTPGSHRVRVTLPGYEDFTAVVAVTAGQQVEVQVEMVEAASSGTSVVPAPDPDAPRTESSPSVLPFVVMGAGAFGVGVAALGAGLVLLLLDGDDDAGGERAAVSFTPVLGARGAGAAVAAEF
jgi:hypothetical protein